MKVVCAASPLFKFIRAATFPLAKVARATTLSLPKVVCATLLLPKVVLPTQFEHFHYPELYE